MSDADINRVYRVLQKRKDKVGDTLPLFDSGMHVPSRDEVRQSYKLRVEQQRQAAQLRCIARDTQRAARAKATKQKSPAAPPKMRAKVKQLLSEDDEDDAPADIASDSGDEESVQVVCQSPQPGPSAPRPTPNVRPLLFK